MVQLHGQEKPVCGSSVLRLLTNPFRDQGIIISGSLLSIYHVAGPVEGNVSKIFSPALKELSPVQ